MGEWVRIGQRQAETPRGMLSAICEHVVDGVVLVDAEGLIRRVNRPAVSHLGFDPTGWSRVDLERALQVTDEQGAPIPPEESPVLLAQRGKDTKDVHVEIRLPDGSRRWLGISASGVVEGSARWVALITRDITERVHLVGLLRESEQRLRSVLELDETLNRINAAIDSELDFDSIMKSVVGEAARVLRADRAGVVLREGEKWVAKYLAGVPGATELPIPHDDFASVEALADSERVVVVDTLHEPHRIRRVEERYGVRAFVAMRLEVHGEFLGVLGFGFSEAPLDFGSERKQFIEKLSAVVALGLENARLLSTERDVAETLQTALLPAPRHVPGARLGSLYRAARDSGHVGGDFYDIFQAHGDKIALVIGDVSGKGLKAATATSLVKNTLRAYVEEGHCPADAMMMTSSVVLAATEPETFATLFLGLLDPASGDLVYCLGGHPPPLLKRAHGTVESLEVMSPIVGGIEGGVFVEGHANLGKADLLLLYTDGVTEARCDHGMLGEARLRAFVEGLPPTSPEDVPSAVFGVVRECSDGGLSDDIAVVAVALEG